jgi:hypothetical protein
MFKYPEVSVGDRVLFYDNPYDASSVGQFGFVCAPPGKNTISILVFTSSSGFIEKLSVRHKADPFWQESDTAKAWSKWGSWELHPETALLRDLNKKLNSRKKTKEEPAAA